MSRLRLLLSVSCLTATSLLALSSAASAAPMGRDVRTSIENSTPDRIGVAFYDDGQLRLERIAPGRTLSDVTGPAQLTLSLVDCGGQQLRLSNPSAGTPAAILRDPFQGGKHASVSLRVNDGRLLEMGGVRVFVKRQADSEDYKELEVDVRACRDAPEGDDDAGPAIPSDPGGWRLARDVRASIRNATGAPVDIAFYDANDRWRTRTIRPGRTLQGVTSDSQALNVLVEDCRTAELTFGNTAVLKPFAGLWSAIWNGSTEELDVGERIQFERRGVRVAVTREEDSSAYKEFAAELLECPRD